MIDVEVEYEQLKTLADLKSETDVDFLRYVKTRTSQHPFSEIRLGLARETLFDLMSSMRGVDVSSIQKAIGEHPRFLPEFKRYLTSSSSIRTPTLLRKAVQENRIDLARTLFSFVPEHKFPHLLEITNADSLELFWGHCTSPTKACLARLAYRGKLNLLQILEKKGIFIFLSVY